MNIITIARMNPAIKPKKDRAPASGMNIAVPIAVVAIIIRSMPVFSVVPSIDIIVDS